jgi:NADPH-dependent 2,4-dienoyl-CoA reductase/sulfur reductase-like enzyme
MTRFSRRRALIMGGAAALIGAPRVWTPALAQAPSWGKRAVIVGGGIGGVAAASALRRLAPDVETVLIEPQSAFFFGPSSIDAVFDPAVMGAFSRDYGVLAARGVRVVRGEARGVDPVARRVSTDKETFGYDALILATGIRLASEDIEGLNDAGNLSVFERAHLAPLRQRIAEFPGGNVVISVPAGALRCPPAPYELALRLAAMMKTRRLTGQVILLDAWPSPQPDPIGAGLAAALAENRDRIDHVPQVNLARVDAKGRKVHTAEGDVFEYDLLSAIPPNKASALVAELGVAGAGDMFAEVDPRVFRTRKHAEIFALGDVARTPYGRSAGAAAGAGENCAREVARVLSGAAPAPEATISTACFPIVDVDAALRLEVVATIGAADSVSMKPDPDNKPSAANLARRRAWELGLMKRIFG